MKREINEELEYWLRLNTLEGLSNLNKMKLITLFGGAYQVYLADKMELLKAGMTPQQYKFYKSKEMKQQISLIINRCRKNSIDIIPLSHDEYPELLKYIPDPPLVLYVRGKIPKGNSIAIVGSRRASGYGIEMAVRFSSELSMCGINIISGLARGIDTAAHCGALNASGNTVAVLGCGVDIAYPPENKSLMERIVQSGAVISEYPPGTPPITYNFPNRNRIISGMSLGTVVVEAGVKSGSLITANFALDQGREVFAVPGNISNKNSMGTNRLIKDGAKLVLNVDDILVELNFGLSSLDISDKNEHKEITVGKKGKMIINALEIEDLYDEELSIKTGIPVNELFEILLDLEFKGLVKKSITGKYMILT